MPINHKENRQPLLRNSRLAARADMDVYCGVSVTLVIDGMPQKSANLGDESNYGWQVSPNSLRPSFLLTCIGS